MKIAISQKEIFNYREHYTRIPESPTEHREIYSGRIRGGGVTLQKQFKNKCNLSVHKKNSKG